MTNATAQRTVTSSPGVGMELEPEVVLPSQFHIRAGLDASLQPEKRLMLAVMEDAVGTFQKYVWARDRAGQRLLGEVEEWFESDDTDWPYSFVNICQSLNLFKRSCARSPLSHSRNILSSSSVMKKSCKNLPCGVSRQE